MRHYLAIICFIIISISTFGQNNKPAEITTYYFIRHAEKERHNPLEEDVHLTDLGHKRAQHWSEILQHITFDVIYTTDFNRTKETVQPTATKNQLPIETYSVNTNYNATFKKATQGKTVLVVGHSNTIPNFVNAVIGRKKYGEIEDTNNGNLYIVTIANGTISDLVLTIN